MFKLRQFHRLCSDVSLGIGDFQFMAESCEDLKGKTTYCNHAEPHMSCCVSCKTLISYQSYVKVDLKNSESLYFKEESDSWFIEQLDLKALKTLAKLKLEMENLTIKELRDLYRKSRVAIHANFTNNRHIHEEILREIEGCNVVKKSERRRENLELKRANSVAKYREVLKEFHEAHERLVDITQMKIEAEEMHTCLMEKLQKTKKSHDEIVARHSREFKPCVQRERKNSM